MRSLPTWANFNGERRLRHCQAIKEPARAPKTRAPASCSTPRAHRVKPAIGANLIYFAMACLLPMNRRGWHLAGEHLSAAGGGVFFALQRLLPCLSGKFPSTYGKNRALPMHIRPIHADEGLRLRALRLRALSEAPAAFGSTLAREEAFAEAIWHERAAKGAAGIDVATMVADQDGRWVGLASGLCCGEEDAPARSALLVGMFVEAQARRRGVGRALLEGVSAWARSRQCLRLALWVTAGNAPAIALYHRCGLARTGARRANAHTPTLVEFKMARELS